VTSSLDQREILRVDAVMMDDPNAIFVFGSNRAGAHGGGAARTAHQSYGAEWGKGEGLTGRAYALPTKDHAIRTLRLDEVALHVDRFLTFARSHPEMRFAVTRIGCGLAGYSDQQIAPLFIDAPANCDLPEGWREFANTEARPS
jgi:hypothetical protein